MVLTLHSYNDSQSSESHGNIEVIRGEEQEQETKHKRYTS